MTRDPFAQCLVFIDASIEHYQHFVQGAVGGAEVVVLTGDRPGVDQITETLRQYPQLDQVHVVSHGAPGSLHLGNTSLTLDTLDGYSDQISSWFSRPVELLLYGCNVAAGTQGAAFLQKLHAMTGAAIAASDDRTGNATLGGDWDLEVTIGDITPSLAFVPETLNTYSGVLAVFNVSTVAELIAAIDAANATGEEDTINLAPGTYTLTTFAPGTDTFQFPGGFFYGKTGLPYITTPIIINGNGATIAGQSNPANPFRLILVDGNTTGNTGKLTLNNLTLTGGRTEAVVGGKNGIYEDGGAIVNYRGTLTATNVTFTNNFADDDGGALINIEGTATLTNSTFTGNIAAGDDDTNDGGGAIENDGGSAGLPDATLTLINPTITGNSATDQGGGIRNRNNGTVNITGGTITGNTATAAGGGIFNTDTSVVNILGTNISGNTAPAGADLGGNPAVTVSLGSAGNPSEAGPVPGTFTITLSAPAPAGGVTFGFTVGGTATFTSDYTVTGAASFSGTAGTVTIPAGATTATITVTPVDDSVFEPTETVQLTLSSGPPAGGSTTYNISTAPASLSITDNDIGTNPTLTLASANNVFLVGGTGGILRFSLNQSSADFVNEVGVFLVDDDAGTVAGFAPGSAGYVTAALDPARRNVIYSVLDQKRSSFFSISNAVRELQYAPNSRLRFYIVSNSTTDAVLAGQTPTSQVLFGVPTNLQIAQGGTNQFTLRFEDSTDADFNDLVLTVQTTNNAALVPGTTFQGVREVVDLTGTGNGRATVIASEAEFRNTIGFYRVNNALTGEITTSAGTFLPGDANYARQAVLNRVDPNNMAAGSIYAPFLVSNNTAENFVAGQGNAFFIYLAANVDGRDHIRLLGSNVFGFEDQLGGGDNDFNDAIVRVTVS